jgi:hypothetical protein
VPPTEFAIFVVHNKLKEKKAELPADVKYYSGQELEDVWVDYRKTRRFSVSVICSSESTFCAAWEATDIDAHNRIKLEQDKQAR